jgi:hypothetical protein
MNRTALGLAIGAGYLLGRTRKLKLAVAVGTLAAGKKLNLTPKGVADLVSQQLRDNPQFKEIGDQLRTDLRGVGKAASGAMVERQMEALADRLHGRTAEVRDQLEGVVPGKGEGKGTDDEADEEYDEPQDAREDEDEGADGSADDESDEQADDEADEQADDEADEEKEAPSRRAGARKAPAKKSAKKTPAKKAPARKTAARTPAAKKTASAGRTGARTASKTASGTASRSRRPKGGGDR